MSNAAGRPRPRSGLQSRQRLKPRAVTRSTIQITSTRFGRRGQSKIKQGDLVARKAADTEELSTREKKGG